MARLKLKFGIQRAKNALKPLLQRKYMICADLILNFLHLCLVLIRHYRKSIGALIVYDITKEQSFMSVKKWIEEVREHAEPEIVIMLVGNKLDLAE